MISIIAAVGRNRELGKDNKLLWNLPSDLKFFKEKTLNHTIIMGKNTFLSIGRALPKRINIVISSSLENSDVIVCRNLEEVMQYIKDDEEVFVIGGASIYKAFLPICDNLYLTEIDETFDADVFFPDFDKTLYERSELASNEENNLSFKHVLYKKKTIK